jgi:hypothetical protein
MVCKWRITIQLAFAFIALFAQSAQGFFDSPWLAPENPLVGQNVSVNIYGGICDWIAARQGYPQLTQEGNSIRLLEYGSHYEPGDELCTDGVGAVTRSIGSYAPGEYTLTVDLIYGDPIFGPTIMNIGVVSFTVRGTSEVAAVPASTSHALLMLIILIAIGGILAMRDRRGKASLLGLRLFVPRPFWSGI